MSANTISLPVPDVQQERVHGLVLRGIWRKAGIGAWAVIWLFCLGAFVLATHYWFVWDSNPVLINTAQHPKWWMYPSVFNFAYQDAIRQLGMSLLSYALLFVVLRTLACIPYLVISVLIMRRYSARLMAVLFAMVLAVIGALGRWGSPNWINLPYVYPWTKIPLMLLIFVANCGVIVCYAFPDGRFVPRWTRWLALFVLYLGFINSFLPGFPLTPYRLPVVGRWIDVVLYLSGLFALVYRYLRQADRLQRQQIKWIVAGFAFLVFFFVTKRIFETTPWYNDPNRTVRDWLIVEIVTEPGWYVGEVLLAAGIGISVFRYRLWEIDLVINRVLVYGSLTLLTVGVYIGAVMVLGSLFRNMTSPVVFFLVTGIIAISFDPLRRRLQQLVNHLMYGERDEPYTVLTRLTDTLEHSASPGEMLPAIASTVSQALKIPYVALLIHENEGGRLVAQAGQPQEEVVSFPLAYQAEVIGALQVGRRARGEEFSRADWCLLENIALQAGAAAQAIRLNAELVRSRAEIVTTREEERRRLRRDLHDGLGPILASQTLKLAAVRQLVRQNPERAEAMVDDLIQQNENTISEVRRLVYGLRPPALDELGLVEAVRDLVHSSQPGDQSITVEGPEEGLPRLPAAVEANAYRIALEGLTNATRHAQAQHYTIRFACQEHECNREAYPALLVEVSDDGVGIPGHYRAGVGLRSMRERAEELGGQLMITPAHPHGTQVSAWLPLVEWK
jgi:signal transduction histidine kinase